MRRFLLFLAALLTALILSGCVTRRACDRKFPPQDSTIQTTIIRTVYRDTTIIIRLPGDTVERVITLTIGANGLLNSDVSWLQTQLARSKAWVLDGKLRHTLIQKDTAVARLIKNASTTNYIEKEKLKYITKEVNRITGWQWFQIWMGRVVIVILGLYIAFKLLNSFVPLKFPR